MTKEEAYKFLMDISYAFGNMSVEYLNEKHGEKMREAIETLKQGSCKDCISRQDALNAITMAEVRWQAVKCIEELPSVLPQKESVTEFADGCRECGKMKTGHWVDLDDSFAGFSACECSECKNPEFIKSKYCPNCGIKMDNPREV